MLLDYNSNDFIFIKVYKSKENRYNLYFLNYNKSMLQIDTGSTEALSEDFLGKVAEIKGGLSLYPGVVRAGFRQEGSPLPGDYMRTILMRDITTDDTIDMKRIGEIMLHRVRYLSDRGGEKDYLEYGRNINRHSSTARRTIVQHKWDTYTPEEKRKRRQDILKNYALRSGDILLKTRGNNYRAVLVGGDVPEDTVFALPLVRIRIRDMESLIPHYLHWFINSPLVQRFLIRHSEGTLLRQVTLKILGKMRVLIPSIRRQRDIGAINKLLIKQKQLTKQLTAKREEYIQGKLMNFVRHDYYLEEQK